MIERCVELLQLEGCGVNYPSCISHNSLTTTVLSLRYALLLAVAAIIEVCYEHEVGVGARTVKQVRRTWPVYPRGRKIFCRLVAATLALNVTP